MLTGQNMAKPNLSITFLLKLGRKVAQWLLNTTDDQWLQKEGVACLAPRFT